MSFFRKNTPSTTKAPNASNAPSAAKQPEAANFEESWTKLQTGFSKLIDFLDSKGRAPFDHAEYSTYYTLVYNLCTQKVDTGKLNGGPTELLYDRYKKWVEQYLKDRVVPALKAKQGENLLMEAVQRWRDHKLVVRWMEKLFNYLDRYYTKHNNRDSLKDVGLKLYQSNVYESIKKDMSTALLEKIQQERNGETIDRSIMKDGVNLFIEMGLNSLTKYVEDFEAPLIALSGDFYKRQSSKWISEDSCPDFMRKAEARLFEELARAKAYLHSQTEASLLKRVEDEVIKAHGKTLLEMENSGFIALLKDSKSEDLSRMYRLFNRIKDLRPMAEMMREYITQEGTAIVEVHQQKEELDCNPYIDALLQLHQRYSDLVVNQFERDSLFLESLKDAFTNFVNIELENNKTKTKTSTAELLSTYCDNIMKSSEKVGEENMDDLLERIVKLFSYISDKDMFQEFYRRQLSKRLLVATSHNLEAEKNLISKLKLRQGASFTSKLEGMIKDKALSEDLQNAFGEYLKSKNKALPCDFSPKVLTTGFWPVFKIDQLTVPEEFAQCMSTFKEFYDSRTESRSLKWVHSLGTCQVLARFEGGDKDLLMSTYQSCIILLFNQQSEVSAQDIAKTLNLPFEDVKKNLLSLCVSKQAQILKKTGNAKACAPSDVFSVNEEFKSATRRIKIPNLVFAVTQEEKSDIDKTTQEDRKHAIEAAIVRIMKARKVLDHQSLILEVSKQLMQHFKPDPKVIKTRIEDLISREYLERDDSKANFYKYLA